MKREPEITIAIPGAALQWARNESVNVRHRNPHLSLDDLAAVLIIRGVIVGATDPQIAALAKAAP